VSASYGPLLIGHPLAALPTELAPVGHLPGLLGEAR